MCTYMAYYRAMQHILESKTQAVQLFLHAIHSVPPRIKKKEEGGGGGGGGGGGD